MILTQVRFALLVVLLPLLLNASSFVLKDELLKPQASALIDTMAGELLEKTGMHGYVVATNEPFPRGKSMVEYLEKFEHNLSKPYIVFIFAPHDERVGIIPSNDEVKNLYDPKSVKNAAIGVVATHDSNSLEDKYNIAIVQGFSELADQVAASKGMKLETTIPNETQNTVFVLQVIIWIGSILVLWIFVGRPLLTRIRNGKQN